MNEQIIISIGLIVFGVLAFVGSPMLFKQSRNIKNGEIFNGKITGYLTKRTGRQFATQYVVGFERNNEYLELPTLLPTLLFLKKIGTEVEVYFSEKESEKVLIKGSYAAEVYAVIGIFAGILLVLLGIAGFMA